MLVIGKVAGSKDTDTDSLMHEILCLFGFDWTTSRARAIYCASSWPAPDTSYIGSALCGFTDTRLWADENQQTGSPLDGAHRQLHWLKSPIFPPQIRSSVRP